MPYTLTTEQLLDLGNAYLAAANPLQDAMDTLTFSVGGAHCLAKTHGLEEDHVITVREAARQLVLAAEHVADAAYEFTGEPGGGLPEQLPGGPQYNAARQLRLEEEDTRAAAATHNAAILAQAKANPLLDVPREHVMLALGQIASDDVIHPDAMEDFRRAADRATQLGWAKDNGRGGYEVLPQGFAKLAEYKEASTHA